MKNMLLQLQKIKGEIQGTIESYGDTVNAFDGRVDVIKKKFVRIQSDWAHTCERLEVMTKKMDVQGKLLQDDNDGLTRIISTLVELQYM